MGKIILIVEDDPRNMKLFRELLQVNGYATFEANNGKKGIEMAREKQPDLILMDIQMPVMDGLEATRILKSYPVTAGIPIIALTSAAMAGDREKTVQAGCDVFLSKPIDIHDFLEKVASELHDRSE
jgi:Response regulator containing a CheY-like receiver domain and an HD-GYP domain